MIIYTLKYVYGAVSDMILVLTCFIFFLLTGLYVFSSISNTLITVYYGCRTSNILFCI